MESETETNNNCEPRSGVSAGRFAIDPATTSSLDPGLRGRRVSVVTLVEGQRKTSIYNWVSNSKLGKAVSRQVLF